MDILIQEQKKKALRIPMTRSQLGKKKWRVNYKPYLFLFPAVFLLIW